MKIGKPAVERAEVKRFVKWRNRMMEIHQDRINFLIMLDIHSDIWTREIQVKDHAADVMTVLPIDKVYIAFGANWCGNG
jgi:hypothetical protein